MADVGPVEWLERNYDKSRRMSRLGASPHEILFGFKDDHHDGCDCEKAGDTKLGATAAHWVAAEALSGQAATPRG